LFLLNKNNNNNLKKKKKKPLKYQKQKIPLMS
jgi:hypothetical protein